MCTAKHRSNSIFNTTAFCKLRYWKSCLESQFVTLNAKTFWWHQSRDFQGIGNLMEKSPVTHSYQPWFRNCEQVLVGRSLIAAWIKGSWLHNTSFWMKGSLKVNPEFNWQPLERYQSNDVKTGHWGLTGTCKWSVTVVLVWKDKGMNQLVGSLLSSNDKEAKNIKWYQAALNHNSVTRELTAMLRTTQHILWYNDAYKDGHNQATSAFMSPSRRKPAVEDLVNKSLKNALREFPHLIQIFIWTQKWTDSNLVVVYRSRLLWPHKHVLVLLSNIFRNIFWGNLLRHHRLSD